MSSIYQSHLSMHPSIHLSIDLSIYLSINQSISSIYPSHLSIYLSILVKINSTCTRCDCIVTQHFYSLGNCLSVTCPKGPAGCIVYTCCTPLVSLCIVYNTCILTPSLRLLKNSVVFKHSGNLKEIIVETNCQITLSSKITPKALFCSRACLKSQLYSVQKGSCIVQLPLLQYIFTDRLVVRYCGCRMSSLGRLCCIVHLVIAEFLLTLLISIVNLPFLWSSHCIIIIVFSIMAIVIFIGSIFFALCVKDPLLVASVSTLWFQLSIHEVGVQAMVDPELLDQLLYFHWQEACALQTKVAKAHA